MRKVRGSGLSYYSFRFNHLFGNPETYISARFESLREDLVAFFDRIGVSTAELHDYILGLEKKNTSEHLHEEAYYTSDLVELVRIRDRQLIDRFSYNFGGLGPYTSLNSAA